MDNKELMDRAAEIAARLRKPEKPICGLAMDPELVAATAATLDSIREELARVTKERDAAVDNLLRLPTVDPVYAAGGCYCRECIRFKPHPKYSFYKKMGEEFYICDPCPLNEEYAPIVEPDDFCKWGKRKEAADAQAT